MQLSVEELLGYTQEERDKWEKWFLKHGDEMLGIASSGDTNSSIGTLITHNFFAEAEYAHILRGNPLAVESGLKEENSNLSKDKTESVFAFGKFTREMLLEVLANMKDEEWEKVYEFKVLRQKICVSGHKIIFHTLIHEIRHWSQISMLVRQAGYSPPGEHDLIFSAAIK